ncbi:MAG: SpoIID/LytB domain-containing protein [Candidatus Omnitrophica bacterium]|nr:SpoIID/LytB domain-containing protein [Candidatus Omnitrophota bacterium]
MKKALNFVLTVFLLFLSVPVSGVPVEKSSNLIRVCVIDGKDRIGLILKSAYKVYEINSDRALMEGNRLHTDIAITKSGLLIGKKEVSPYGVKVKTAKDSTTYIDGRRFRGDIDIIRKDDLKLTVVNNVDLEDYLYGVLYHEVSHRWPQEALKAQAIAARTFALYQKRQNALQPYDLRSDIYSQVYGGSTSEKWSTTRAVNLTKGKILVYNGDIFPSYYHATCAGHTEDASNLWNIDLPPLKGVECDSCKYSPHYKWVKGIPLWEITNKLKENGYKTGRIASIIILSKNSSGRIEKIEIKDEAGVSLILTAKDFRQMIGPNAVRSTKFDISIKGSQAYLQGYGWGHGAGMCQWGAFGMARKGKKAEEILKIYYPGAEIATIDKLKGKT